MSRTTSGNHQDAASGAGSPEPREAPEGDGLADGVQSSPEPADAREATGEGAPAEDGSRDESREGANGGTPSDEFAPESPETAGEAPEGPGEASEDVECEVATLNDRHLRLAAEFENYRKRVRAEKRETWARAQADLVGRLVESVDDLQRVALLDPDTASVQDIVEGVDLVERKLLRALADAGLEVLDPAGEDFDPTVMEAVMVAPASTEDEDDTVDLVLQRGYLLQGHLVRPARVSVRKRG